MNCCHTTNPDIEGENETHRSVPIDIKYPTVEDVYGIHAAVVENDPDASEGIIHEGQVNYALSFIEEGHFGEIPETVHEKAAHLMRLLAANHEFADGNKRTALATTAAFYWANGFYFEYEDEEIRTLLKVFSVLERVVDVNEVAEYFSKEAIPKEDISEDDVGRAMERITGDE